MRTSCDVELASNRDLSAYPLRSRLEWDSLPSPSYQERARFCFVQPNVDWCSPLLSDRIGRGAFVMRCGTVSLAVSGLQPRGQLEFLRQSIPAPAKTRWRNPNACT